MKIARTFVGAIAIALCTLSVFAQQSSFGYHSVACLKVKPDSAAEFQKFLADDVHKVAAIAHIKIIDCSSSGWLKAAICANGDEAIIDGDLDASPAKHHELLLNLRATGTPAHVQELVEKNWNLLTAESPKFPSIASVRSHRNLSEE